MGLWLVAEEDECHWYLGRSGFALVDDQVTRQQQQQDASPVKSSRIALKVPRTAMSGPTFQDILVDPQEHRVPLMNVNRIITTSHGSFGRAPTR